MKNIAHVKPMEHLTDWDKLTAVFCAIAGGLFHLVHIPLFTLDLLDIAYWSAMLKVAITAGISGFMGLLGKAAFTAAKKWWNEGRKKGR
jgi:hypothetical protein